MDIKELTKTKYYKRKYIVYRETLTSHEEYFWSFIGSFVGIMLIAFFQSNYLSDYENIFLIGSFGASSVLVYGVIQSPFSQPRNVLGGHIFSAIIGVTAVKLFPGTIWLSAPLAVSSAIVVMQFTRTIHPPGGATALIAIIGTEKIKSLGYFYVLSPILSGTLILLTVAFVFNNATPNRRYPTNRKFSRIIKRTFLKRKEN